MDSEKSITDNRIYKKSDFNEEFDINKLVRFIFRNKIFISSITGFSILVSGAYAYLKEKIWLGEFQIVITKEEKNNKQDLFNKYRQEATTGIGNIIIGSNQGDLRTQETILKSPSVLLPVYNYVKKYKKEKEGEWKVKYKNWVSKYLETDFEGGTRVLNVLYKDSDKEFIKSVLNKISNTYQIYSRRNKEKSINDGIKYLNSQVSIYKEKSKSSSQELIRFSYENDINEKLALQKSLLGEVNLYSLESIESDLKIFKDKNADPEVILGAARSVSKLNSLTSLLDNLENEISLKESIYVSSDQELEKLRIRKNSIYNNIKSSYINYLEALKVKLEKQKNAARKNINILQKYSELKNEADQDLKILSELDLNLRNLLLTKAKSIDPWELITKPTLDSKSISASKRSIVSFGLLFGLFLAILLAFYKENKSDIIFEKDYIQKCLNINCLETFKNSNKESWEESISLLSRGSLISSIKDLTIINLSINEEDFEYIKKKLKKYIIDKNILFIDSLIKAKANSHLVLGIEVGCITKSRLLDIKNKLELLGCPVLGLIVFENEKIYKS